MWDLRTAQTRIIIAGCLAMAYTQLTLSPATIEYARSLGAGGLHIGVLGALPTGMLFLQFISAVIANHLRFRRRLWLTVSIVQRLIFLPLAFGPFLSPETPGIVWVWVLVLLTALNHSMLNFSTPLWLSWMGDYLPREGLSRYWGIRHLWMQWTAVLSLAAAAGLLFFSGLGIQTVYAVMIVTGSVFGVADILMFRKVEEPPVTPHANPDLRAVLTGPFRHAGFRSFIAYGCFWNFAAMVGAPFITLYLLAYVGLSLFQVMVLWAFSWAGGAVFSAKLGRMVEEFGNRPMLISATLFKSVNMIALVLVPSNTTIAMLLLIPVFMLDALLNAAIAIASNGFMLKNSPAENRSMYIAAGTAIAGMVGGLTSIAAGGVLSAIGDATLAAGVLVLNGFHILFLVSLVLRWVSVIFARRVKEPEGRATRHVLMQLIGATPLRFMRFPVGLYRERPSDFVYGSKGNDGVVQKEAQEASTAQPVDGRV